MKTQKPSNIREFIWKIIDTDLAIKKDLSRGIINVRSLSSYLISKYKVDLSLDSVISAVRRYPTAPEKQHSTTEAYALLKQAKMRTNTRMASLSLKKNEEVTAKLGKALPGVNFEVGEVLRIIEGAKLFKIIVDQKSFEKMLAFFDKKSVLEHNKHIGMIEISYPDILQKTPGVFSALSTELASNDISIIDALIISNEHIIIVDEKDLLKAFEVLYTLCQ